LRSVLPCTGSGECMEMLRISMQCWNPSKTSERWPSTAVMLMCRNIFHLSVCFHIIFVCSLFNVLSVAQTTIIASINLILVTNELERMWKETLVAWIKILFWHLRRVRKESIKKPDQGIRSFGGDSNWAPLKYKSECLQPEPPCSAVDVLYKIYFISRGVKNEVNGILGHQYFTRTLACLLISRL
jgi:hypothetical protein